MDPVSVLVGIVIGVVLTFIGAAYMFGDEEALLDVATNAPFHDRVEAVFLAAGLLNVPIKLDLVKEENQNEVPEQDTKPSDADR